MSSSRVRVGFTVVELTAALALIGLIFAGIWALLEQVTDGRDRITQEAGDADRTGNGERLLTAMFANAEVITDSVNRFVGAEDRATFNTWCVVPQGWLEKCRVLLQVSDRLSGSDVSWVVGRDTRLLRHFAAPAEFRYYGMIGGQAQWLNQWGRSIALPSAIALVSGGDTTVISGLGHQ
ncbi:MAG: hypothetical protein ABJE10_24490 [bacterium]